MKLRFNRTCSRSGFSLLEMVVVVAIMAIVAGAAIPVTSKVLAYKARNATREAPKRLIRVCSLRPRGSASRQRLLIC